MLCEPCFQISYALLPSSRSEAETCDMGFVVDNEQHSLALVVISLAIPYSIPQTKPWRRQAECTDLCRKKKNKQTNRE